MTKFNLSLFIPRKTILTALLMAFSTASFSGDNDGVGDKSSENIFCKLFKISCEATKSDQDSVGGKSSDYGNDMGIPPDTQPTRSSGAVGSSSDIKIRGAN